MALVLQSYIAHIDIPQESNCGIYLKDKAWTIELYRLGQSDPHRATSLHDDPAAKSRHGIDGTHVKATIDQGPATGVEATALTIAAHCGLINPKLKRVIQTFRDFPLIRAPCCQQLLHRIAQLQYL